MNLNVLRAIAIIVLAALAWQAWKTKTLPYHAGTGAPARPSGTETSGPPMRQAAVPPTYVLDLESGRVVDSEPAARDLWWQAKTHTERCLCPYYQTKALIAPIAAADFEAMDGAKLALLEYSNEGIADSDEHPGVEPGTALAVRTTEGNFAKVRVVMVGGKRELTLQWRLYPAAAQTPAP